MGEEKEHAQSNKKTHFQREKTVAEERFEQFKQLVGLFGGEGSGSLKTLDKPWYFADKPRNIEIVLSRPKADAQAQRNSW